MIYDLNQSLISPVVMSMDSDSTITFSLLIDCEDGKFLSSETVAGLVVNAKRFGDASWINIESLPIDLTPYIGEKIQFDFQIIAAAVLVNESHNFKLIVR